MDTNRATTILAEGYTCAEAVLMATAQEYGITLSHPHLAMGFGGGMGFLGEVCGAVSGAVMAISLVKGSPETPQQFKQTMALVRELRSRFEAKMKTSLCRELTGVDLARPGGFDEFAKSDVIQQVCPRAVETAYHLVMEVLAEDGQEPAVDKNQSNTDNTQSKGDRV